MYIGYYLGANVQRAIPQMCVQVCAKSWEDEAIDPIIKVNVDVVF
jgi:hypothetical protein